MPAARRCRSRSPARSSTIFTRPGPSSEVEQLTTRELEILRLLAKGHLYKEIAEKLAISMSTVRTHISAVYEKLHVHSRTEAAMKLAGRE